MYDWNYEALLFGVFFSLICYDSAPAIFINSSSGRKFNRIYFSKPWNYWLQCSLCDGVWKVREFYTSVETENKICEMMRHWIILFFARALRWYDGISIPWHCIILPSYKKCEYRTICNASIGLSIYDITPISRPADTLGLSCVCVCFCHLSLVRPEGNDRENCIV